MKRKVLIVTVAVVTKAVIVKRKVKKELMATKTNITLVVEVVVAITTTVLNHKQLELLMAETIMQAVEVIKSPVT